METAAYSFSCTALRCFLRLVVLFPDICVEHGGIWQIETHFVSYLKYSQTLEENFLPEGFCFQFSLFTTLISIPAPRAVLPDEVITDCLDGLAMLAVGNAGLTTTSGSNKLKKFSKILR